MSVVYENLVLCLDTQSPKIFKADWYVFVVDDQVLAIRWYLLRAPNNGKCYIIRFANNFAETIYHGQDMYDLLNILEKQRKEISDHQLAKYLDDTIEYIRDVYFFIPTWSRTFTRWKDNTRIFVNGIANLFYHISGGT